jgi:hypothetical protein
MSPVFPTSIALDSNLIDAFLSVLCFQRGIMEDQLVLELFGAELSELRASFDQWTPYSQKMKDLRRKVRVLPPGLTPCRTLIS